jgi:hypothetical protein
MKRQKILLAVFLSVLIGSVALGIATSGDKPEGKPFQAIWNAVDNLQDQIDNFPLGGWTDDGTVVRLTTSTDYVGIGTTDPWTKLEVNGDVRVGSITDDDGSTEGYGNKLYFSGGDDWPEWDSDNSDDLWIARYNVSENKTELRINLGDDAEDVGVEHTDKFVIGTIDAEDGLWYPRLTVESTGNVGIGTDTPATRLDVAGVIRSNGGVYLGGWAASGDNVEIYWQNDKGHIHAFDRTNSNYEPLYLRGSTLHLNDGNVGNTLINESGGNVGIGTTSPTEKLDVAGYVKGRSGLCIGDDCRNNWPEGAEAIGDKNCWETTFDAGGSCDYSWRGVDCGPGAYVRGVHYAGKSCGDNYADQYRFKVTCCKFR